MGTQRPTGERTPEQPPRIESDVRLQCGLAGFAGFTIHLVHRHWNGKFAACGAGRITVVLPNGFDPFDRFTCAACADLLQRSESSSH